MACCRLHSIRKRYGREEVLRGVDLGLEKGSIVGLVGDNGSGKSTLLKILAGILRPDAGALNAPTGRPRVGYMPENCQWYPYLTGAQVLRYFGRYTGATPAEQAEVLARVGLWEARDKKVRAYSKGMRQKLGLAQAISGAPDLLVLDEPTNGLDPHGIIDFYAILHERVAAGTTVILSSHLLTELDGRITHLALLYGGTIVTSGPCDRLMAASRLPHHVSLQDLPDAALKSLQEGPWQTQRQGTGLELTLPKSQLSAFWRRAAALGAPLDNLRLQGPTLDDLYLHIMARQTPSANGRATPRLSPTEASP